MGPCGATTVPEGAEGWQVRYRLDGWSAERAACSGPIHDGLEALSEGIFVHSAAGVSLASLICVSFGCPALSGQLVHRWGCVRSGTEQRRDFEDAVWLLVHRRIAGLRVYAIQG